MGSDFRFKNKNKYLKISSKILVNYSIYSLQSTNHSYSSFASILSIQNYIIDEQLMMNSWWNSSFRMQLGRWPQVNEPERGLL